MKKYLLAGTSAFALALTAGAANAQSAPGKFDIKISGDAYFEAGMVSQTLNRQTTTTMNTNGNGNQTFGDFTNRLRVTLNPEATADNGMKYGANVRIRANSGGGTVDGDRAYIYASGLFGSVQAGVTAGPSDVTYVSHPQDWQMLGIYDEWRAYMPTTESTGVAAGAAAGNEVAGAAGTGAMAWGQFATGAATTTGGVATEGVQLLHSHDVSTKLVYYSPRFFGSSPTTGLQAAVSYTPRVGDASSTNGNVSVNTGVNRASNSTSCVRDISSTALASACQQVTAFNNVFEITSNYTEKFGDWLVKASLGYEGGEAVGAPTQGALPSNNNTFNRLNSLQAGLLVGWRDLQIGGGFVDHFKSGYRKSNVTDKVSDQTAWNVGAQYTYGPLVGGVKFMRERDAGDLTTTGDRTLDATTAGVMYTLAPGLRTGLEYTYFSAKSDISMDQSNTATGSKKQTGSVILLRGVASF